MGGGEVKHIHVFYVTFLSSTLGPVYILYIICEIAPSLGYIGW